MSSKTEKHKIPMIFTHFWQGFPTGALEFTFPGEKAN